MKHDGLCDICSERRPVQARIVAWRNPVFGRYENVDRCLDEVACRARIEARGDEWPVIEAGQRPKEVA